MGVAHLEEISAELIKRGRDAATPVAVIRDGTMPGQQVLTSTLGAVAAEAGPGRASAPPAVVVIGEVSRLRERAWSRAERRNAAMSNPTLLAVAHGSRHPAAQVTIGTLARQVSRLAPVLRVRVAFVQHAEPSLPAALAAAGPNTVIVPLLLSTGYHLTTDLAGAARATGARLADPLGPDSLLVTALAGRLAEAGVPDGTPVVLAAAGSSDPAAQADAAEQAGLLAERLERPGDGGVRVGGPAFGAPRRWPSCGPATGQPVAVATLPAGARPLPGPAPARGRRLGDRAAGRPPGPGRRGHRPLPHRLPPPRAGRLVWRGCPRPPPGASPHRAADRVADRAEG